MPHTLSPVSANHTPVGSMNPASDYSGRSDGLSTPEGDSANVRPVAPSAPRRTLATARCGQWRSCLEKD